MTDESQDEWYKTKYEKPILRILNEVREWLLRRGVEVGEPYEMVCDDYSWWLSTGPSTADGDDDREVDVIITIANSEFYDGHENGLNFMLDVTSRGGLILGGLAPFNYTDRVWVPRDDRDAVAERWAVFNHGCDVGAIVDVIMEHRRKEAA